MPKAGEWTVIGLLVAVLHQIQNVILNIFFPQLQIMLYNQPYAVNTAVMKPSHLIAPGIRMQIQVHFRTVEPFQL